MSEDREQLNPIRLWREWFVKSEKAWSQAMTDMMGDERFSQGMGRYMQEALHTHRMFSESMAQYLANLNLPSRQDVLDIGDRLGQVEDTLAALQVELRELRMRIAQGVAPIAAPQPGIGKPARTKRPAEQA